MHILIVGGGGREHSLAWRLAHSPQVRKLSLAPGNAGTHRLPLSTGGAAENLPIPQNDVEAICQWAKANKPDLVIIGPEEPLALGLSDRLTALGLAVFGPSQTAAQLETDKAFAKQVMKHYAIPTAEARIFTRYEEAKAYIASRIEGVVVKCSGLAAGKGVFVCDDLAEALIKLEKIMVDKVFGDAGKTVIVEELLHGPEVSVFSFVDGKSIFLLDPCQDHKRALDNDMGPNTGGMGAYCPAHVLTAKQDQTVTRDILVPVVDGMNHQETPYKGMLYTSLMVTPAGPKVIEFNARFGDPECQVLMMRYQSDLVDALMATVNGQLDTLSVQTDPRPAVCVIVASGGYPGEYQKNLPIHGLADVAKMQDVVVFHSGTQLGMDNAVATAGGRVLGVTAIGGDLAQARERAYEAIDRLKFDNMHFRTDIGAKGLKST